MTLKNLKHSIKKFSAQLILLTGLIMLVSPAASYALNQRTSLTYFGNASAQTACTTLGSLDSTQGCGGAGADTVKSIVKTVVNILSIIVGAVAVVMIILSALKFITSGGDSQKASSARTSLAYALIGLVVVALTQTLVHFTLKTSQTALNCPYNNKILATSASCKPKAKS